MSQNKSHNGASRRASFAGFLALAVCVAVSVDQMRADAAADAHIKEQIIGKLAGLVSIHPEQLGVDVNDGAVKLTGSVASIGEKLTIARIVGSVQGVITISNDLSIRTLERPEPLIAQEVTRLLQNRPKFRGGTIQVSVIGSKVTLDGKVKHNADRSDAEEIAGTAPGVTSVVNRIRVDTDGNVPDATIKSKVTSILVNPVTFGVIKDLEIEVEEGTVTLKGSVRRQSDRGQAERLATGVEGVVAVNNMLTVTGS